MGEEVFHVVGFGTDGKIPFRRKVRRLALIQTFSRLPPSVVGMKARLSQPSVAPTGSPAADHLLIYVKLFVERQKNDYDNAGAIAEAALRPNPP